MGRGVAAIVCWLVALGALAGAADAQPFGFGAISASAPHADRVQTRAATGERRGCSGRSS